MSELFVTGASGFVGRAVARRLAESGTPFTALLRQGAFAPDVPGCRVVRGDLLDGGPWAEEIRPGATVLHLAALTGKAEPAEHRRVNHDGTLRLLEAARAAKAGRFVFVSTIAVRFGDLEHYPYARAKQDAEAAVHDANLPCLILRPTQVFGPGSAPFAGLLRLATLPLIPVFGDGTSRLQPVFVDDLARDIVDAVERGPFDGRAIELGGPQALTIEELLREIRRAARGDRGRVVHLPLGPTLPLLALAERVALRWLPVTVGQLSSFRFDGTADPAASPGTAGHRDLEQSIRASLA